MLGPSLHQLPHVIDVPRRGGDEGTGTSVGWSGPWDVLVAGDELAEQPTYAGARNASILPLLEDEDEALADAEGVRR